MTLLINKYGFHFKKGNFYFRIRRNYFFINNLFQVEGDYGKEIKAFGETIKVSMNEYYNKGKFEVKEDYNGYYHYLRISNE